MSDASTPLHPSTPATGALGTPLMRQHAAIKKEHPTALLFFRVGDFYELFYARPLLIRPM